MTNYIVNYVMCQIITLKKLTGLVTLKRKKMDFRLVS